jgi:F-type H+-transporting ATPase subunit b
LDINATLIVQMIVFAIFVWFTMKFVWPPLASAMDDRQQKIADGLAASERGQRELELAQHRVSEALKGAKSQASDIIEKANRRASQIVEDAKEQAKNEAQRQAKIAHEQLVQEVNNARDGLKKQFSSLAVAGAEKILEREVDENVHSKLLGKLIEEI